MNKKKITEDQIYNFYLNEQKRTKKEKNIYNKKN